MPSQWLTILEAAAYIGPRRAGKLTRRETIWRWMRHGLRGVRLRFQQRPVRLFTTAEWLEQFFAAVTEARERARQAVADALPVPSRTLQRRYEAAAERNRRAGIR